LISTGSLVAVLGAYFLFFKGPAANQEQQLFRVGVVAIGAVLSLVGVVLKLAGGRGDAE
jgi:hypothetical protein